MSGEPININLNYPNCIQIMIKYTELIQQKGIFSLEEAQLLKRASDVLVNNVTDKDPNLTKETSINLFIQSIVKGQNNGCFTLNDAFILYNVIKFLNETPLSSAPTPAPTPVPTPDNITLGVTEDEGDGDDDFDLSELSKPVPFNITNV
jgi:hypothetical protein